MATLNEQDVHVTVYTYKDGIAARMGHDLKVKAHRVSCTVSAGEGVPFTLDAVVDPREVKVDCAQAHGRDDTGALSASDKSKINGHIQDDVLQTRRHPEIRFASTRVTPAGDGFDILGNLTLTGHTRPVHLKAQRAGDRYVAQVRLNQPDFGIKPFSAPFGVLKIKPDVLVEVSLPADLPGRA